MFFLRQVSIYASFVLTNIMNFDLAIKKVIEKLSFSEDEYNNCVSDVKHIEHVLNLVSKSSNTPFKDIFNELGSTATFMKGTAIDIMPDFNYYLPFKMPMKVKPIFYHQNTKNLLLLKSKVKCAFVVGGYVSANDFHILLSNHIKDTINELKTIECGPRFYTLSWQVRRMGCHIIGHSIKAISKQVDDQKEEEPIEITFDFVPVFKFLMYETPLPNNVADNVEGARYWITCSAFMQDGISVFSKVTPRWQLLKPEQKYNASNSVRLIKAVGRKNNEEHFLEICSIKNAIFWRVQELGPAFDNYTQITLFMDLYGRLINNIDVKYRPILALSQTFPLFKPFDNILKLYETFKVLQVNEQIQLNDILEIFGLPNEI